jgi:hypothetical protein
MEKSVVEPEWESPKDAAIAGGVSRSRIYELLSLGLFDTRKCGSKTLIRVASRREYFNSLPKARIALHGRAVRT